MNIRQIKWHFYTFHPTSLEQQHQKNNCTKNPILLNLPSHQKNDVIYKSTWSHISFSKAISCAWLALPRLKLNYLKYQKLFCFKQNISENIKLSEEKWQRYA